MHQGRAVGGSAIETGSAPGEKGSRRIDAAEKNPTWIMGLPGPCVGSGFNQF
jgi:hypothetical protein